MRALHRDRGNRRAHRGGNGGPDGGPGGVAHHLRYVQGGGSGDGDGGRSGCREARGEIRKLFFGKNKYKV